MKEITVQATAENTPAVLAFADEQLRALGCPGKARMQINVAVDELFSNIVRYAYCADAGPATLRVEKTAEPASVTLTFIDRGAPYNPLQSLDPDVTQSAEKRKIGGLGIFIVKRTMDALSYEYKDGKNILRIRKDFS